MALLNTTMPIITIVKEVEEPAYPVSEYPIWCAITITPIKGSCGTSACCRR